MHNSIPLGQTVSEKTNITDFGIFGYQYQFAISKMGDGHFDYAYRDRIPENYMIEECSVDEIVTMQNSNYSAVASNFKTYNSNNDWMERIGTKFVEAVEDEAISMAAGALLKFIF